MEIKTTSAFSKNSLSFSILILVLKKSLTLKDLRVGKEVVTGTTRISWKIPTSSI